MGFFKNWPQTHPQILLHFLIHIYALMLCTKFELILSSTFQVMAILNTSILDLYIGTRMAIKFNCYKKFYIHVHIKMLSLHVHILKLNVFLT